MYIPVILITLSTIIYIVLYNHVNEKKVIFLKIITSSIFIAIGIIAIVMTDSLDEKYSRFIMIGLSFGFVGDIILGIRRLFPSSRKALFISGMTFFLVGHMFYILAFSIFSEREFVYYLILGVVLTFIVIIIIQHSNIHTENTRPAMYLYMFVCSFVVSYSFFNMIDNFNIYRIIIFVGAISFVSSDFILSFLYFKKMKPLTFKILKKVNIATYYLAQTIFALSIYFIFL